MNNFKEMLKLDKVHEQVFGSGRITGQDGGATGGSDLTEIKSLGLPSSRQDAKNLMKWVENMLEEICNIKGSTNTEMIAQVQFIYNLAWRELTRQVSVTCVERGYIMHRIFKAYVTLI